MKQRTAYHPLRPVQGVGNPNSLSAVVEVVDGSPLAAYLERAGIPFSDFETFSDGLRGEVVTPFSSEYASARAQSDLAYDRYPLLVVYCADTADVVASIDFASSHSVAICARAGGHNTAGYSVLDDRMVIDVSRIGGVMVDEQRRTATVGAGITWGEFNHELQAWGLHTPGGSCSSVGVTGFTLGGGYGYTSMRFGLACDHLVGLTMVTAAGQVVVADEGNHPELLWAHQGGTGGNFGVVVSLTFALRDLARVWPIALDWPIEHAAAVIEAWQDHLTTTTIDDDLGVLGFLALRDLHVDEPGITPRATAGYFGLRGLYSGSDPEAGQRALAPLFDVAEPSCPSGPLWQRQIPYSFANEHLLDSFDAGVPADLRETKRCAYVERRLTAADYQRMIDYFMTTPNLYNIVGFEPYGGAINAIAPDARAFVHREAFFDVFVDSFWSESAERDRAETWLHDFYERADLADLWSRHYYQNYPNSRYDDWQHGYFGDNYARLQQIKQAWDPQNVFVFEQSIELPASR